MVSNTLICRSADSGAGCDATATDIWNESGGESADEQESAITFDEEALALRCDNDHRSHRRRGGGGEETAGLHQQGPGTIRHRRLCLILMVSAAAVFVGVMGAYTWQQMHVDGDDGSDVVVPTDGPTTQQRHDHPPTTLAEQCSDESLRSEPGYLACRVQCQVAECCYGHNSTNSSESCYEDMRTTLCHEYYPCKALFDYDDEKDDAGAGEGTWSSSIVAIPVSGDTEGEGNGTVAVNSTATTPSSTTTTVLPLPPANLSKLCFSQTADDLAQCEMACLGASECCYWTTSNDGEGIRSECYQQNVDVCARYQEACSLVMPQDSNDATNNTVVYGEDVTEYAEEEQTASLGPIHANQVGKETELTYDDDDDNDDDRDGAGGNSHMLLEQIDEYCASENDHLRADVANVTKCKEVCSPGACCFPGADRSEIDCSTKVWCGAFSKCSFLFVKGGMEGGNGTVSNHSEMELAQEEEGDGQHEEDLSGISALISTVCPEEDPQSVAECRDACEVASCCFRHQDEGGCKEEEWCSAFAKCATKENLSAQGELGSDTVVTSRHNGRGGDNGRKGG